MAGSAIPHLDAASAGARSDTRSDTYDRGFRRGDSVIHREQAYLSPESLRDSASHWHWDAASEMERTVGSPTRAPTRTTGASDTDTVLNIANRRICAPIV